MEKISKKALTQSEMEKIMAGSCNVGYSFGCGLGLSLTFLTGGLGAVVWGPSTGAMCYAAYRSC